MSEGHAEAKVHRRLDNTAGIYITFLIHPQDAASLDGLRIGDSVQLAWAEIVNTAVEKIELPDNRAANVGDAQASPRERPKRAFKDLSYPEQAGILCQDSHFQNFIREKYYIGPACEYVRRYCCIDSRAELSTNHDAANKWRELEAKYQSWIADQRYSDARR